MPIPTSLPSNVRTPGTYHNFDFSAAGGPLTPLERRVVIVAEKSSVGTAVADTPIQLLGDLDGDAKCGAGSLAALMNRKANLQAKVSGLGSPEVWVVPLAEPVGGTAAEYTLTLTGPATESKDLILRLVGRLVVVGVNSGDSAITIATALKSKLDELAVTLPFTASRVNAVVTIVFRTKGVNGNGLSRKNVQLPAGVGVAHAASVAGAGSTSIAAGLAALYDKRYHGIALANHVTGDAAALLADLALAWGYTQKSFRFYKMGEPGSLGTAQTLQASFNDSRFEILSCENIPVLPGEMAIAMSIAWWAREAPNCNLDDEILALEPPDAADVYTGAEIESALASGLTPLVPSGIYVRVVRSVTTQITLSAAPFEPLREPALPRTAAYMAEQIDIGLRQGLHQEVMYADPAGGDDILARARDIIVEKHRAAERERYIRDVDDFLTEIKAEFSANAPGRIVGQDPMRVAGPHHQTELTHIMYLR